MTDFLLKLLESAAFWPALAAIVTALVAGLLSRSGALAKQKADDSTAFRKELIEQLDKMRDRLDHEEKVSDEWRTKFFDRAKDIADLTARVVQLTGELDDVKRLAGDRRTPPHRLALKGEIGGEQPEPNTQE